MFLLVSARDTGEISEAGTKGNPKGGGFLFQTGEKNQEWKRLSLSRGVGPDKLRWKQRHSPGLPKLFKDMQKLAFTET